MVFFEKRLHKRYSRNVIFVYDFMVNVQPSFCRSKIYYSLRATRGIVTYATHLACLVPYCYHIFIHI